MYNQNYNSPLSMNLSNNMDPPNYYNSGNSNGGSDKYSKQNLSDYASGLGGILSGLGGMFGGQRYNNPSDAAAHYYDQIPGTIKPYYDPYINQGQHAMGTLEEQYQKMLQDPSSLLKFLGQGYQQSPGYDWRKSEAMTAANNAAAASGRLGSLEEQQNMADIVGHLADQDFETYLGHILGLHGAGISGEQQFNELGYKSSSELAENLARALMSQGNLAYKGQENKNQFEKSKPNWWDSLGTIAAGAAKFAPLLL